MVLVNEEHVLLEAGVEMGLEAELPDDGVVMAVDVGVDSVHALEDLADEGWVCLGEWDAWVLLDMIASVMWLERG